MSSGRRSVKRSRNDLPTTQPFVAYSNTCLETRTTPKDLCFVLQRLTNAQKSDIRDMAFEPIQSFSIDSIPPGLGHWLLVNYDHKRNVLNVGSHVINITPSKVHDVLGVPMGEITVSENRMKQGDVIRREWREQFFYRSIRVKDVITKFKSYKKGGRLFKLNFLVLFNTIMGESTKGDAVNHKFLSSIMNEGDISNMDWCSYIITCLKRTKEGWSGIEPYNGPLTFLAVLYAHELRLRSSPEKAITPAIQYVTTEYLADLDEVQARADEDQAAVDHNANVSQEEEEGDRIQLSNYLTAIDQNGKGPSLNDNVEPADVGQTSLFTSPGYDTQNMVDRRINRCNQLVLLRDENSLSHHDDDIDDDDDSDIEIIEPKQEEIESDAFSSHQSDIVYVKGYRVNRGIAPTLVDILKKHGDFAAGCVLKTGDVKKSVLESVCEIYKQIENNGIKSMSEAKCVVSDAKAVKMDMTWLEALLESVREKKKKENREYCVWLETKASVMKLIEDAEESIKNNYAKRMAAHLKLMESEKSKKLLCALKNHLDDTLSELKR